ncbi:MAG: LuxR C-terminal-related transcriptional regulator [Firmicutes bacterium]|nr:LuxR C-terminal-related transcriptional regulator [Bacillota bacterium]MCM1401890.1 LuxR C-terminal-related transcriptional regulator [Bacteroides sp.]MCM1477892.1 LuxR C-terminal-related transcriptional regulator [Bacteroides sp.]
MKRLTVAIATESQIIASGLKTLLTSIKDVHLEPVHIHPRDISLTVSKLSPAALIADMCDACAVNELKVLRSEMKTDTAIIGIYHSALTPATTRTVDATISIYDDSETLNEVLKRLISINAEAAASTDLTPREREVIRGIVKGLSNKEIASEINVSVNTVMTHRRNIASKLRIHSPAGLTIYAIVSKLVSLEEIKNQVGAISD